jgi:Mrp family chromosome partitioning ATPase
VGSKSVRERPRVPKQRDQTIPIANEQPPGKEASQAVDGGSEPASNWPVQVANEPPAQDQPEPVNNGHARVANEQPAQNEPEPVRNGHSKVANQRPAQSEPEPVRNGHSKVANQQAAHEEGEPATNGSFQLVSELEQVAREGAQPSKAEERLPSHFSQSINDALTRRQTLPGFADPRLERISSIELPPWFIDRCRSAYLSVQFDPATECRVIGVTSAAYGEGKTSVAIGIATAMALDTKKPTLLIECDFASPSLYRFFGIAEAGGLSDWLGGGSRLRIVRGAALVPNLFVIPSGTAQTEPARFFYQLVDRNVFDGLRGLFGNVVIDLPPMLHISYSALACALADRLLIVARSGLTQTADLETMVTRIGKDRVSGVVLTGAEDRIPGWLRTVL